MTLGDLVLWALAASMAAVISYSLKWTVDNRRRPGSLVVPLVVFVLVMMLSMVVSAVVYYTMPSLGTLVDLIVVNMAVMGLGALPFVLVIFRSLLAEEGGVPATGASSSEVGKRTWGGWAPVAAVASLVLLNEFFMGWAFQLAAGGFPATVGTGLTPLFSSIVSSYWFLFTMAFEMAFTAFLLRKEIPRVLLVFIAFQAAIMFLSPPAFADARWVAVSVFGGSVLMILLFIFAFEHLARNPLVDRGLSRYLALLLAAYAMMMAGLYYWQLASSAFLFALSILAEMGIYLGLVMGTGGPSSMKTWKSDPWWVLGLLTALFVGEFFMGAVLDSQVNGTQALFAAANLVPVSGGGLGVLWSSLYDFIAFFSVVTLSPWFLIMMGAEMGALVLFRMREVRETETKVRLGLVIVAYAAYTVYVPSFLIPSDALAKIPFLGWNMGIGTAGPVAPALLLALIGTYIFSGALSFLFGARQFCSMFCSAALMYQGTFYDSMKTFNRTSALGKKLLTSRLSDLYRTVFSVVWISLIAAAVASYLDSTGALGFSIFGSDPTVFLYSFYFGFLWYVVFVTIPFVGTYGCVTLGWCHWGTFNQMVSRLGLFKLKVRDPGVCVSCETKDCAKACPVGLTDLPGSFISKGEFKSSKCIGVGDCVGACPYSNEYFFDVRGWFRRKRGGGAGGAMMDLKIARGRVDEA
ncbi:MAG TPA: 4Fe-4S dicluster domain-containing protein [Nitrososphaerales archaeon]|nr:4Fe-4S dicluster domain-containing protein [Nitrososphaerales archaeon]